MKRVVTALLICTWAGLLPAAAHGDAKQRRQVVEGNVLLPAQDPRSDLDAGCWTGLQRRIMTLTNGEGQGVVGYHFDVDKSTWKKPFRLVVTGGEGTVDLDLFLATHVPPLEEWIDAPYTGGIPQGAEFASRREGGETGIVPRGAVTGFVCVFAGPEYSGYDASFKYEAGKGVPKPKPTPEI